MGWNIERGNSKEKGWGGGGPKGALLTIRNKQFQREQTGCPTSYWIVSLNCDFRDKSENLKRMNHFENFVKN